MSKHCIKQHKCILIFEQIERSIVTDRGKLGECHHKQKHWVKTWENMINYVRTLTILMAKICHNFINR